MAVQGQGINNAYHHQHHHQQQQPAFNNSSNNSGFHNNSSRFDPNLNNVAASASNNSFENIILVGGDTTSLLQLDDPDSRYLVNSFTDRTQAPPPSYESLAIGHHHHHASDYHTTSNNNDFILQDNTGNQIIFHRNDPNQSNHQGNRLYHQPSSLVLDDTDDNSAELVSDVQAMIDNYGLARNYETSSFEDTKNEIIINQFDILGDEQSQGINLLIEQNPNVGYLIDQHSRQQSEEDREGIIGPVLDRERLLLENTMSPLCEYICILRKFLLLVNGFSQNSSDKC